MYVYLQFLPRRVLHTSGSTVSWKHPLVTPSQNLSSDTVSPVMPHHMRWWTPLKWPQRRPSLPSTIKHAVWVKLKYIIFELNWCLQGQLCDLSLCFWLSQNLICESLVNHVMKWHHIDGMNYYVSHMETRVCRQHYSMNNAIIFYSAQGWI